MPVLAEPQALSLLADANTRIEKNDLISAEALLLRARQIDPQSTEITYQLGYVRYLQRNLVQARTELLEVVKRSPPAMRSRYLLGRIALLEGKPLEAVAWLLPVSEANPPVPDATSQLAKAYFDSNQTEKALDLTEKALKLAPWDGALHYRLGRILQQMGQPARSEAEFKESVTLKTADAASIQELMECSQLLADGKKAEAVHVRDLLLSNPLLDPDVLLSVGVMLARAGLDSESIDAFHAAAERDPSLFHARFNEGLALLKTGLVEPAEHAFVKSLQILPQSIEANSALALAYVMGTEYGRAVPLLEFVHKEQPDNLRTNGLLTLSYIRSGAAASAIPILRRTLGLDPRDPKPYFLLIEALNATESQAEAVTVAEDVAKRFPDLGQAQLAWAQQLALVGHYRDAGAAFEKTLKLEPRNFDACLGWGEAQNKTGDYASSLTTFQRALALKPENETAAIGAARDLVSLQRPLEAREILEAGIAVHPTNAQLRFELSRVYARLGEREKAAEQVRVMDSLKNGAK